MEIQSFNKLSKQVTKEMKRLCVPKLNEQQIRLSSYYSLNWSEIKITLDYIIANSHENEFRKYSM
jgi:hypothetical protein